MSPIVADTERYPGTGRDPAATFGEVGLAGHWMKRLLHTSAERAERHAARPTKTVEATMS